MNPSVTPRCPSSNASTALQLGHMTTDVNPADLPAIKRLLAPEPPEVLYHYTHRAALIKILESRSVVASHIRYLNDAQEMAFAIRRMLEVLEDQAGKGDAEDKRVRENMALWLRYLEPQTQVFVFSLSRQGDLLSQWRAYSQPGDGYAVGFDSLALAANTARERFSLVRCIYDAEEQRAVLLELVSHTADTFREHRDKGMSSELAGEIIAKCFLMPFLVVASVLKDQSFEEEKEWRLISHSYPMGHERVLYRSGARLLIPYVLVRLARQGEHLPIKEIVVAPSGHGLLEVQAVRGLLIRAHGPGDVPIHVSKIPYRG